MRKAVIIAFVVLLACSKRDAADVAAPAGKVVEVAGTVSATRNGATRTLAVADQVFSDETVDTGSDGSVTIELSHNHARWAMEPGQKKRVDESAAWKLAEQSGSAVAVDHATSAAGRNAERQAAETQATAGQAQATGGGAATPPTAPVQAVQGVQSEPPREKKGLAPPKPHADAEAAKDVNANAVTAAAPDAATLIDAHYSEISACYANRTAKLVLTIKVVEGKAAVEEKSAERKACVDAVLAKLKLPEVTQTVMLTLAR